MTPFETGKKLVELCKQNKNLEALDTLYSRDIVSLEPMSCPGMPMEMHGIEAIRGKNLKWFETQQVNSSQIDGPFVNGDRFSVNFKYDVTNKKSGKIIILEEIGVYKGAIGSIFEKVSSSVSPCKFSHGGLKYQYAPGMAEFFEKQLLVLH